MSTRTVNIALTEQRPQQRRVIFTPNLASLGGTLLLEVQYETVTNDLGVGTIALPVAASGDIVYNYKIPGYPGVSTGSFAIGAGSAVNLDDLIAAGGTASDSVITYIDERLADYEQSDADLTALGAIDSAAANVIASTGTGWVGKTWSQLKVLLSLDAVNNTSDTGKPVSTAQAAADAAVLASAQSYADALVVGLVDDRGNYDASVNTFPASGGSGSAGAVKKGDLWTVSVAGTLGGHAVTAGDLVRALVDTPGQTDSNWALTENNIGYVAENSANKGASGGYVGLTLFKINFKNAANSFTSFLTNSNTAARTYTFADRDGTIADDTDIAGRQPLDSDLTTIAGLAATTDNFIVSVASAWASRTPTQVKTTLGLGTTDAPTFGGLTLTDTVLAGSGSLAGSLINLSQTWNTSGAPTALKLNVTNTASGASALLMDLQVGAATKFRVAKDGSLTLTGYISSTVAFAPLLTLNGTAGAIDIARLAAPTTYMVTLGDTGSGHEGVYVRSQGEYSWSSTSLSNGTPDTFIGRQAAGVIKTAGAYFTGLVQFGLNTSAGAALKRVSATLAVRLGDDSAFTQLQALSIGYSGSTVADSAGSGSPESVVTASVGSTYRRTDGGAGTSFYVKESGSGNTGWVAK